MTAFFLPPANGAYTNGNPQGWQYGREIDWRTKSQFLLDAGVSPQAEPYAYAFLEERLNHTGNCNGENCNWLFDWENPFIELSAIYWGDVVPLGGWEAASQKYCRTALKYCWMRDAGIREADYGNVDYIVSRESGWRTNATNSSSGAYGLPQALPASKLGTAGADWRTNPVTQLRWANSYAVGRYGSWGNAVMFWQRNHWW